jgi:hypothetical protein
MAKKVAPYSKEVIEQKISGLNDQIKDLQENHQNADHLIKSRNEWNTMLQTWYGGAKPATETSSAYTPGSLPPSNSSTAGVPAGVTPAHTVGDVDDPGYGATGEIGTYGDYNDSDRDSRDPNAHIATGNQESRFGEDGETPLPHLKPPTGGYIHGGETNTAWDKKSPMSETERLSRLVDRLNNRLYYKTATANEEAGHYRMEPIETEDSRQQKDNRGLKNYTNKRARENQALTDELHRRNVAHSEQLNIANIALTDQLARTLWSKAQENDEEARAYFNKLMKGNVAEEEKMALGLHYLGREAMIRIYEGYASTKQQEHSNWYNQIRLQPYTYDRQLQSQFRNEADRFNFIKKAEQYFTKLGLPTDLFNVLLNASSGEGLSAAQFNMYKSMLGGPDTKGAVKNILDQWLVDRVKDISGKDLLAGG